MLPKLFLFLYLVFSTVSIKAIAQDRYKYINKYSDITIHNELTEILEVPNGEYKYGGAGYFSALIREGFVSEISKIFPQFQITYQESNQLPPGSTSAIKMLLERKIDFAHINRPLSKEELVAAKSQNIELEVIPIAFEGIGLFVRNDTGVKELSLEELGDIFSGKITNWREVGGADTPITIIDLISEFENMSFSVDEEITNKTSVRDITSAIRMAASIPGALGYASAGNIQNQQSITPLAISLDSDSPPVAIILQDGRVNVQAIASQYYPLTRKLYLVIRRDKSQVVGVAYANLLLSKPIQKIFERAGLVAIY